MNKVPETELTTKILHVTTKEVEPTEADMRKIRPYLLREFGLNDLYIREMWLANDQVDRSFERFDLGYLKRFRATIAGKSVLVGHDSGTAPVGRFFDARMDKDEQGWNWVVPRFYMPMSAGNELARANIDSGVWSYVSIGAHVDWHGLICDICKRSYFYGEGDEVCPHWAGEDYDGVTCTLTFDSKRSNLEHVEAVEGSIVYLGCQYEAAIRKSEAERGKTHRFKATLLEKFSNSTPPQTDRGDDTTPAQRAKEDTDMAELAEVQASLDAMTAERDTLAAKVNELEANVKTLQPAADEGLKLKTRIVDEIKRLCACVGEALVPTVIDKITDIDELLRIETELSAKWADMRGGPHAEIEGAADTQQTVQPVRLSAGII